LVHDYYNEETRKSNYKVEAAQKASVESSCIHLVVDTTLTDNRIGWKAYVSSPVTVRGVGVSTMYNEVGVGVTATDCERVGCEAMIAEARGNGSGPGTLEDRYVASERSERAVRTPRRGNHSAYSNRTLCDKQASRRIA